MLFHADEQKWKAALRASRWCVKTENNATSKIAECTPMFSYILQHLMQAITFLVDEFVPFLLQLRIQIYFLPCNPNVTSLWHCNFSSIPLSRMEKIAKEGYTEQCRLPSWISPFIWLAAAIASADADMRRILQHTIFKWECAKARADSAGECRK